MQFFRLTLARTASIGLAVFLALGGLALGVASTSAQTAGPGTFAPGPGANSSGSTYSGHIDAPAASQAVPQNAQLLVTGWACDTSAQGWAGFNQVQVYNGLMNAGGTMLASGSVGMVRSDVAGMTGDPSCAPSGFSALVPASAVATAGAMTLNVYLATPSNGWWYLSVPVTVAAAAPSSSMTGSSTTTASGTPGAVGTSSGSCFVTNPVVPGTYPNGITPTPIASSNCSTLPSSPDVHITIVSPLSTDVLQNSTTGTLTGVAYDDRAPSGQSGISQVQVWLNGLAGNNGSTFLGQASLGSSGGNPLPSGTNSSFGFFFQFNPMITPGTSPNVPWNTGGTVLYVYAFGMNGAVSAVSAPFSLIG